jgi:3-deoxy-D-manno-octulosonate 8-phosphate phosphatase KdsC-like HAD superfamily phosphatase
MNLSLTLVSIEDRLDWIRRNFCLDNAIYMGDGLIDKAIFQEVYYAIAPSSALKEVRRAADFVTTAKGGERSVAEACLHIAKKFFGLKL